MAIIVVGLGSIAVAEDAEAILKRGMQLRRQGRDADARVEFQRAVRVEDSGRAWAQLALAEQALGLWTEASAHLDRALERAQEPWIQKNHQVLAAAQATIRSHLCQLEVWGEPAGASVLIDGQPIGKLPSAIVWWDAGSFLLEIRATGFVSASKTLRLPEGGRIREHAQLKRRPTPAPVAAAAAPGKVKLALPSPIANEAPEPRLVKRRNAVEGEGSDAPAEPEGGERAEPVSHRWWLWTLAGTVVLAAGGTTAWVLTHRNPDECAKLGTRCYVW